jgi:hypothetical protein
MALDRHRCSNSRARTCTRGDEWERAGIARERRVIADEFEWCRRPAVAFVDRLPASCCAWNTIQFPPISLFFSFKSPPTTRFCSKLKVLHGLLSFFFFRLSTTAESRYSGIQIPQKATCTYLMNFIEIYACIIRYLKNQNIYICRHGERIRGTLRRRGCWCGVGHPEPVILYLFLFIYNRLI